MSPVKCVLPSRTRSAQWGLRVVGDEARKVLLLIGEQRQQHDVSRGQEGQGAVRVATLSEEDTIKVTISINITSDLAALEPDPEARSVAHSVRTRCSMGARES